MDPRHLLRLQEEQKRAIQETEERIGQFEKFKSDYKVLQQRLKTLPDKVTHDVMVPFGKFAFMPGQIVHTNEILVLLGDNWFAERSAKQACHIADRRVKELDERIKDLQKQHDLLAPRLGFTSGLQAEAQCVGDVKEIVEEYDEEKEKLWDEQHRKNVHRYHSELKRKKTSHPGDGGDGDEKGSPKTSHQLKWDEELWKRLDALEMEETRKGELHSSFEEEGEDDENSDKRKTGRRVSWIDERAETRGDEDSDDLSEEGDDDGDEESEGGEDSPALNRSINFTHTKTLVTVMQDSSSNSNAINSPGDIYKLFAPKSILRKGNSTSKVKASSPQQRDVIPASTRPDRGSSIDSSVVEPSILKGSEPVASRRDAAFTGMVVEKPIFSSNIQSKTETQDLGETQTGKRMSKFKAQRMKQT